MPDMVADDDGYITYDSPAGPEYSDGSRNCQASAVNERCTPFLREAVRERSYGVGEGTGGAQHREGGRGSICWLY